MVMPLAGALPERCHDVEIKISFQKFNNAQRTYRLAFVPLAPPTRPPPQPRTLIIR